MILKDTGNCIWQIRSLSVRKKNLVVLGVQTLPMLTSASLAPGLKGITLMKGRCEKVWCMLNITPITPTSSVAGL
jgi:hypothetical protein